MNLAPLFKTFQILAPKAQTATASGTGKNVIPGESPSYDAIAVVQNGAATGTPTSYTLVVTVEESATVNGTYDTLATFGTITADNQISHLPVKINPAKPFIRATATIAFVGGTSPALLVDCALLVNENVASDSNEPALT